MLWLVGNLIEESYSLSLDLGFSDILGEKISKAYQSDKIIGAVCHGPLGLLKAKKEDGSPRG